MPILLAVWDYNHQQFAIYSGETLDAAPEKGLNGGCDFILTDTPPLSELQAPIMTVVEAKKNDVDGSLGQCAAQMLGARLFNQHDHVELETIFGCVTTGEAWQFLKLEQDVICIDQDRYYIDNLETNLIPLRKNSSINLPANFVGCICPGSVKMIKKVKKNAIYYMGLP